MDNSIIFLTDGLFRIGGTEKVVVQLYNEFLERHYNIRLIVPGGKDLGVMSRNDIDMTSLNIGDFPKVNFLNKLYHRIRYFFKTLSLVKKNDVVFSFFFDLNVINIIVSLFKGGNVIVCEHIEYNYHSIYRRLLRVFLYKLPHIKVVCLTERDTKKFESYGIDAITIQNFTESKNISIIDRTESKRILAIGRLTEQKNFSFLIDAFNLSKLSELGWSLDIVGDGDEKQYLLDKIEKLNLNNNINILGFTKKIGDFYQKSDIFCMSSRYEAFPMVLIEAMSYGCPVISTDCPTGPAEILQSYQNTQLVTLGDVEGYAKKLSDLALNRELQVTVSHANYEDSKNFLPSVIMGKWTQLVNTMLE
ncbi:glycosyltransferase [Pectobacterium aroidearum]|uniref:glycosyltransferase n=1 Tax=Pectobacterium aroidearum TaxID=1201031 RepID=UPI0030192031